MFSTVFVFQVFQILKVPNKFPENQIKIQRVKSFRNHQVGARGDPPGPQAPWWRGQGWGSTQGGPWLPPSSYIYPPSENPRHENPFFQCLLCSAAAAVSRSG